MLDDIDDQKSLMRLQFEVNSYNKIQYLENKIYEKPLQKVEINCNMESSSSFAITHVGYQFFTFSISALHIMETWMQAFTRNQFSQWYTIFLRLIFWKLKNKFSIVLITQRNNKQDTWQKQKIIMKCRLFTYRITSNYKFPNSQFL